MNPWSQVALLAKREFLERVRSKPFIITMSLLVVAILAIGPVVSRFSGGDEQATSIGLAGEEIPGIEQELQAQAVLFEMEIDGEPSDGFGGGRGGGGGFEAVRTMERTDAFVRADDADASARAIMGLEYPVGDLANVLLMA